MGVYTKIISFESESALICCLTTRRPSFKATRESHTSCGSRKERRGASINKTQLGALPVLIPARSLPAAFGKHVHRIELLARHLDAAAAKAEAMAAALAAEMFDESALRESRCDPPR
jgi:hypothetical protein